MQTTLLDPPELLEAKSSLAVVQSLDNQWVPESLYGSETLSQIDPQRIPLVRRDILLALLTAEAAVINRAYFWNSGAMEAFIDDEPDALRDLVRSGTVVAYLFKEKRFDEFAADFDRHPSSSKKFANFATGVGKAVCTRLSRDDASNNEQIAVLSDMFHSYFAQAYVADHGLLARTLATSGSGDRDQLSGELHSALVSVAKKCVQLYEGGERLTRSHVYEEFVSRPGTVVAEGAYREGPLGLAMKQMADLKYNANLADVYQANLITGMESPSRVSLQETRRLKGDHTLEDLTRVIRSVESDEVLQEMRLPILERCTLEDVMLVRDSREGNWRAFLTHFEKNFGRDAFQLEAVLDDEKRIQVAHRYAAVVRELADVVANREQAEACRGKLQASYWLSFAGRIVGIFTAPGGWAIQDGIAGFLKNLVGRKQQSISTELRIRVQSEVSAYLDSTLVRLRMRPTEESVSRFLSELDGNRRVRVVGDLYADWKAVIQLSGKDADRTGKVNSDLDDDE